MAWYSRRTNYPYHAWLAYTVVMVILAIWALWWLGQYTSDEAQTIRAGRALRKGIEDFTFERGTYPVELAVVQPYLRKGRWPENPYTGQPVVDTGSPDFEATISPGNVYYERLFSAPAGEGYEEVLADRRQVGYYLHVFGEEGEIWKFRGHTLLPVD